MVCFLACFGFPTKRKRRKSVRKDLSDEQVRGSYEPLDSDVITKLDIREKQKTISSVSLFRDKRKEQSSCRIKKKVSFNLNVKTYEPVQNDETASYLSESDEETKWEYNEEEMAKASTSMAKMGLYPSNYRYQNCIDNYDEEDGIKLEESDIDDNADKDEEDDEFCKINDYEQQINKVDFSDHFDSLSMELEKRISLIQLAQNKITHTVRHCPSLDEELKKLEWNSGARDRRRYVHSVLNPVENLTQWKAVKATEKQPLKNQKKENVSFNEEQQIPSSSMQSFNLLPCKSLPNVNRSRPLMQNISVDASLSNWLVSSHIETIDKSSITADAFMSTKKYV